MGWEPGRKCKAEWRPGSLGAFLSSPSSFLCFYFAMQQFDSQKGCSVCLRFCSPSPSEVSKGKAFPKPSSLCRAGWTLPSQAMRPPRACQRLQQGPGTAALPVVPSKAQSRKWPRSPWLQLGSHCCLSSAQLLFKYTWPGRPQGNLW